MPRLPVLVLCGGLGTRLRAAVADRPKVLAPVGGAPFLSHLLAHLARQGFTDVVLATGYLGEMVEACAGDGSAWGVRLRYAHEPEPLGTGGAVRFAAHAAGIAGPLLVMNGDTFFSAPLGELVAFHRAREGAAASLALARVEDAARFGTVVHDPASGLVSEFVEKGAQTGPAWINAGVYVLEPAALAGQAPGPAAFSLERDVFPRLAGHALYGCPFPDAVFLDIGTPGDYARAPDVLNRIARD